MAQGNWKKRARFMPIAPPQPAPQPVARSAPPLVVHDTAALDAANAAVEDLRAQLQAAADENAELHLAMQKHIADAESAAGASTAEVSRLAALLKAANGAESTLRNDLKDARREQDRQNNAMATLRVSHQAEVNRLRQEHADALAAQREEHQRAAAEARQFALREIEKAEQAAAEARARADDLLREKAEALRLDQERRDQLAAAVLAQVEPEPEKPGRWSAWMAKAKSTVRGLYGRG